MNLHIWLNHKIHGISPALPERQSTLPCQPIANNQFVGYDLSRAQLVEAAFANNAQLRIRDYVLTST